MNVKGDTELSTLQHLAFPEEERAAVRLKRRIRSASKAFIYKYQATEVARHNRRFQACHATNIKAVRCCLQRRKEPRDPSLNQFVICFKHISFCFQKLFVSVYRERAIRFYSMLFFKKGYYAIIANLESANLISFLF